MARQSRRRFLQTSAALLGTPLFVPATALGRDGKASASERITLGFIGTGGRGRSLINAFVKQKDVQIVAVNDVDAKHLKLGAEAVSKGGGKDCKTYQDFRDLIGHKGLDAVVVATPDHWHALASVAAAKADLDVYCEKPLANSIGEGRAICEAVRAHKCVLQTGSHERSGPNARFAAELVRNGRIGKLHTIRINLPCTDTHHRDAQKMTEMPPRMKVPEGFDYNFWLGHTAVVPYYERRCHFWWRFILAYGGGEMTDRGAHVIDLAQLCAGTDDTGPTEIEAKGKRIKGSLYDAFWDYEFTNVFANGVKMIGTAKGPRGLKLEGSDGWIFIHVHGAKLEASDPAILKENAEKFKETLGRTPNHQRNFLEAVRSRKQPFAAAEIGHRSASICHLNNIAMTLGRKLRWDPKKEEFIGDGEANKLLTPPLREPWKL